MLFLISSKVWLQRTLFTMYFIISKEPLYISLCGRHNLTPVSYVWAPDRLNNLPETCFQFLFKLIGKSTMAFLTEANDNAYKVQTYLCKYSALNWWSLVFYLWPIVYPVPQTELNFWLSLSVKHRRNPCSRPLPVYQDLRTYHDWPV